MRNNEDATLRGVPETGDTPRWHELLDQLDAETLTETFVSRLSTVPDYAPLPVPAAEVRRTGRLSFEALIHGLKDGGFTAPVAVASDVGVSRARAGIPLTSLMTAIRLDFSVLWEGLTQIAQKADAELVIRHTGIVLQTVDDYAGQTQQAYAAERQRMNDEASSVRQGLIASLFQGPPPPTDRLAFIAKELGFVANEPLIVIAATEDDVPALRVFVAECTRAGAVVHTHHLGDALVAFTRSRRLPGSRLDDLRSRLYDMRVGIAVAEEGFNELRQVGTDARDLAYLLSPHEHGAMTWERGWARLAAQQLAASGHGILTDVNRALESTGSAERSRLEESVRSYLATGSVGDSAAELYCHRNTLTNRLRRFAELTGVDPTVPEQAARLVVGWA
ncbi:helix-turn-helix domain-containing protein [Leucobacter sp. HY1910]